MRVIAMISIVGDYLPVEAIREAARAISPEVQITPYEGDFVLMIGYKLTDEQVAELRRTMRRLSRGEPRFKVSSMSVHPDMKEDDVTVK